MDQYHTFMFNYFIFSEHDEHRVTYNGSAVIRGVRLMANGPRDIWSEHPIAKYLVDKKRIFRQ